MSTTTALALDTPRLRRCTFVQHEDGQLVMIAGADYYAVAGLPVACDVLLQANRYLDGRHTIAEIARRTGVDEAEMRTLVQALDELGLLRPDASPDKLPPAAFLHDMQETCAQLNVLIGYHPLLQMLREGTLLPDVYAGLLLETYHSVKATSKHVSVALAHSTELQDQKSLFDSYLDGYENAGRLLDALDELGIPRQQAEQSHPLVGTKSLLHMLCDVARRDTFSYLACTSLVQDTLERTAAHFAPGQSAGTVDHQALLAKSLEGVECVDAKAADETVACLYDLKDAFDQFHDQIIAYYSDASNPVPRQKADYRSL